MTDQTKDEKIDQLIQEIESITEDRDKLKVIIDEIPANIYWTDMQGRYAGVNRTQRELCLEEPIGKTIYEILPRKMAEEVFHIDEQVRRTGKGFLVEESAYYKDSKERYYGLSYKKRLEIHGRLIGLIGVTIDISKQKKSQLLLEKATKEALKSSEAKTEFLFGLGHDILTPCLGIFNACNQLLRDEKDTIKQKKLETISEASSSLTGYVRNILEYMRQDSYKKNVELFSIKTVLKEVYSLYATLFKEKRLSWQAIIDPSVPEQIATDFFMVRKILVNLVGNAVKYTHEGGVTIKVDYTAHPKKSTLTLSIQDTGIGIAKKNQTKIFDSFVQVKKQKTSEGVGLGLASVKKYIKLLSGKISVQSSLGAGATFKVCLPMETSHLKKKVTDQDREALFCVPRVFSGSELSSVLIVEDDAISAKVLQSYVARYCGCIDIAMDVKQSIDKMYAKHYDLIISDLNLSDGTGFDVIQTYKDKIRKLNTIGEDAVPGVFVLLTSDYSPIKFHQAIEVGFSMVYNKPISMADLAEIMQKLMGLEVTC
jgi:signal transduction histidine kinase/ActR/RegA family two-component response regulator